MDTKINGKDNSLGMLLNDRGVYDKLYETMNSANNLLLDLKNHPKRYVHFSVFGKKKINKCQQFQNAAKECRNHLYAN